MNPVRAAILASVSSCIVTGAFAASPSKDDPVTLWNANAGNAALKACIAPDGDPFHESRMYAMMHIAIHDALNAIDRRYQPHTYDQKADPGTSPEAAVAAAAHGVMSPLIKQLPPELLDKPNCIESGVASIDEAYATAIAAIPDSPAKAQGIALGEATAAAILTARANDHGNEGPFLNKDCPPVGKPGVYQCVPDLPFTAFEKWDNLTPFVLQDAAQFRPGPPYPAADAKAKADTEEVKSLGGDGKTTPSARTPDQTQIAMFWWESSPLKWSRIARTVATDKGLDSWDNARLFALLNMGLTDGYIAMVSGKNHYNYWRPVTAIHFTGDEKWTALMPTPPDQDYPSGHAIEGGVGAEVLKQLFGTDRVNFQDCGVGLPAGSCFDAQPVMRSYTSFTQAGDENAESRVFVGFHFRNSTVEGNAVGHKIGEKAATLLPPVK